MEITEKVAYLKGLAEGLALDAEANKESKLIAAMIDILDDIALEIADMEVSSAYTLEEWEKRPWYCRAWGSVLKLGAIWL